jgi:LysR family transcriptional regulator for bpeEF and oprC
MDKLQAMQTFVRVAQASSFTAAAETLGVPKASVSQRISALESHLGVRLLQRSTRRVSLTDDGRAYHEHCLRLLADLESVEESLRGNPAAPAARGLLRIDTLPSVARWVLAPALPDFVARFPHLELRIGSTDRVVDLLEEGVDCAIRGGTLPDSSLVARRLCTVHMGLYASPSYLSGHPALDHPNQLVQHHWVGTFAQGLSAPVALSALGPSGHPAPVIDDAQPPSSPQHQGMNTQVALRFPAPRVSFNEGETAVAASVAGLGLVIAPPFSVEHEVRNGRLRPVLPAWSAGQSPLSVVYPSHRHLSPRLRCFVDWLSALIQAHPSLSLTPLKAAIAWLGVE